MRKRYLVQLVVVLLLAPPVGVSARGQGDKHVSIKNYNNQVQVTVRTPSHLKFRQYYGCITDHRTKKLNGKDVPAIYRRCPGLYGGNWFEVRVDWGSYSVLTADPPELDLSLEPHWYTQRIGYFWLDPVKYQSVKANLVDGAGSSHGSAILVPYKVTFDPGLGREGELDSIDCDITKIFRPYDKRLPHYDPERMQPSCSYIYFSSSRHGPYRPRVKLYWKIVGVQLYDVPDFLAGMNTPIQGSDTLESSTRPVNLRVEEIQTILTCVSTAKTTCDA